MLSYRNNDQIKIPKDAAALSEPITLRVMNLDRSARAPDLREHLSKFAKLQRVKIQRDLATGKSNGFAYVTFDQFPLELFDQSNPEVYAAARLFMDRHLVFKAANEYTAPIPQEFVRNIEDFSCDKICIGSFLPDGVFYCPSEIEQEDRIILQLQSQKRIVKWYLRTGNKEDDDYLMVADYALQDDYLKFSVDELKNHWITVKLKHPPKIFKGKYEYVQETGLWEWTKEYEKIWNRAVGISRYPDVAFGDHLIYRFRLSKMEIESGFLELKLRDVSEFHVDRQRIEIFNPTPFAITREIPFANVSMDKLNLLPFDVLYKILVLISNGLLKPWSISETMYESLMTTHSQKVEFVLELINLRNQPIEDFEGDFKRFLADASTMKLENAVKLPNCLHVRKVFISPTRLIFTTPVQEMGNRVIRQYMKYAHRFMRVTFVDENLQRLGGRSNLSEEILHRMRSILGEGIVVGDRKYEFLAFSSSQLREHSCWFFASIANEDGQLITPDTIRSWMGNFDGIKTVAKYSARLGQCFSSTTPFFIHKEAVAEIPDVERDGYCFSDGVGTISKPLAEDISRHLGLDEVPSAFQVRMNGYKGVLSVDPSIQPDQPQVCFRPSMRKFTTENNTSLDIIRASTYAPAYLNHQIITVLNSVFVEDEVFLDLQRKMERNLQRIGRNYSVAANMIGSYCTESQGLQNALKMIDYRISLNEPFLQNVIQLFQCHKLKEAKFKARILVEDGVQLVGILDETNTLEYGQIFVQYSDPLADSSSSRLRVVIGNVLMTKMPAVHPGDIRVLECIDHPALRHYYNVVVFPQKGPRPHTIEASGSDLDGDVYFVTWHQALIPTFQNFDPQDYSAPKPPTVEKNITIDDIKDFMIDYMKGDALGLIAVSHKIHADMHRKGVRAEVCVELARLHSKAVDFPKTGVPADYDPRRYHVASYPDFLNMRNKPSYESPKALGKLYRDIKIMSFNPIFNIEVDPIFVVEGYEEFVAEAKVIKAGYDFELQKLMKHHDIRSEFELVTQMFLDFDKKSYKKDYELRLTLSQIIKKLVDQYVRMFWRNLNKNKSNVGGKYDDYVYRKASAWYHVSYSTGANGDTKTNERVFYSFPWMCVPDLLLDLYRMRGGMEREANNGNNPDDELRYLGNGRDSHRIIDKKYRPVFVNEPFAGTGQQSNSMMQQEKRPAQVEENKSPTMDVLAQDFEVLDF